jgi:hypothetical protein
MECWLMRSPLRWLIATASASLVFAVLSVAALADGPRPTLESESVTNLTATDATLEAQINPGGGEDGFSLETTYEFFLEAPWCGSVRPFGGCEASGGVLVYKGTIAAGATSPQLESVDLASVGHQLSPDTTYGYRAVARNEVGEAFGFEKTFTTPAEGKPPAIESVSVSQLTKTDATLEATIDTEGLETEYAFHLWSSPCSKHGSGCELVVSVKLPCDGRLFGSFVPQIVSLDLNSAGVMLGEGEYGFSVTATNAAGPTTASGGVFEVPEGGAKPLNPPSPAVSPGPVSDEPTVPLGGDQQTTSGASGSPTAAGGSTLPAGVTAKATTGKPSGKRGKHHKRKHHGMRATQRHPKVKRHK